MTRGEYGYGVCADCKNAVALDSNYEPDESCKYCSKGGDPTNQVIESKATEAGGGTGKFSWENRYFTILGYDLQSLSYNKLDDLDIEIVNILDEIDDDEDQSFYTSGGWAEDTGQDADPLDREDENFLDEAKGNLNRIGNDLNDILDQRDNDPNYPTSRGGASNYDSISQGFHGDNVGEESKAREDSDLPAGWNQDSIDLWYGLGDNSMYGEDDIDDENVSKHWEQFKIILGVEQGLDQWEKYAEQRGIPEWKADEWWEIETIPEDNANKRIFDESYDDDLEPNEHRDELFPPKKKRKPKGTEFQFQDETQVGHYGAYPDSEQMSQDIDKLTQLLAELQNELTQAEEIPQGNIQSQIEDVETQLKQLQNDFDNIADYGFYDPTTMEALQKKFSMCNDCMGSALEKLSKANEMGEYTDLQSRAEDKWREMDEQERYLALREAGIYETDGSTDDLLNEYNIFAYLNGVSDGEFKKRDLYDYIIDQFDLMGVDESYATEDADSSIAPQIDYTEPTYDDLDDRLKGVTQADTADSLSNFGVDLTFPKYNDNSDTTNLGYLEKAIFNESQMAETIYEEYYNSIAPMFATYDTWDKYAKDSGLSQQETVEIWQQNNEGVGGEPDFSFESKTTEAWDLYINGNYEAGNDQFTKKELQDLVKDMKADGELDETDLIEYRNEPSLND